MMKSLRSLFVFVVLAGLSCTEKMAPDHNAIVWQDPNQAVCGELFDVDGLRAIRLWGTNYERGYALGYLLAPDIHSWLLVTAETDPESIQTWEDVVVPNRSLFSIPAEYLDEIRGVFDGITQRAGGSFYVAPLNRAFVLEDLEALYCSSDMERLACTSFAVWDSLADGGGVITARKMDYQSGPPPGIFVRMTLCIAWPLKPCIPEARLRALNLF